MNENEKTAGQQAMIEGLRRGDEKAYSFLFRQYYTVLCRYATLFVNDYFVAECIVSDLIAHLWETREKTIISSSLKSYLFKATRNRCLNYLQSQTYISTDEIEIAELAFDEDPMSVLLEGELSANIEKALAELPDTCRAVYLMSRHEHLKYEEIAEKMGISVNTVKYHLRRAVAFLRDKLRDYLFCILLFMFVS